MVCMAKQKKEVQEQTPAPLQKTVKIWFPCDTYIKDFVFCPGEQEISVEIFSEIEGYGTYKLIND